MHVPSVALSIRTVLILALCSHVSSRLNVANGKMMLLHVAHALPPGIAGRETHMVTVMIWASVTSRDVVREFCRTVEQEIERTHSTGWLRGRCFVDTTDHRRVILYQEWTTQREWERWYQSAAHQRALQHAAPFLQGELRVQAYEDA
jgi:quinol monooxygenase YgiN